MDHPLTVARKRAGLSKSGLALRAGVDTSTVYRAEQDGASTPRFSTCRLLAHACGVRVSDIWPTHQEHEIVLRRAA